MITTKIEVISPEMASRILQESDGANWRSIVRHHSDRMRQDMIAGRWDLNGESIKFNASGKLCDGQHRLRACVMAGVPFQTLVVYGVEKDQAIDCGMKRTVAQLLKSMGERYCAALAGALEQAHMMLEKQMPDGTQASTLRATPSQLVEFLGKHGGIRKYANMTASDKLGKLPCPSKIAGLIYVFSTKDQELADNFADALTGTIKVSDDDPVSVLLKAYSSLQRGNRRKALAMCIKAWNAWRTDTIVRSVNWQATGAKAEPFPEVL